MSQILKAPRKIFTTVGFSGADYICDGSADNIQIKAAVDAVVAAGGGTVFIKEGTYDIQNRIIVLGSNIHIRGASMGSTKLILGNLIDQEIFVVGNGNANYPDAGDGGTVVPCMNVSFSDMELDGNVSNQSDDVTWASIRYSLFATRNLIRYRSDAQTSYGGEVARINAHHSAQNGISNESHLWLTTTSCICTDNKVFGFWWENANQYTLTNSWSARNLSGGFKGNQFGDATISNNESKSDDGASFLFLNCNRTSIVGNKIYRSGWHGNDPNTAAGGMSLSSCSGMEIIGNTFFGVYGNALTLQGVTYSSISNNHFRRTGQFADNSYSDIYFTGSACNDNIISNNTFWNDTATFYTNKARYNIVMTSAGVHLRNRFLNNPAGAPATAYSANMPRTTNNIMEDSTTLASTILADTNPELKMLSSADSNNARMVRSSADGSIKLYNTVAGLAATLHSVVYDGTNDYIAVPHASDLNISADFTLCGWIKLTNLTLDQRIFEKNYTLTVRTTGKLRCTIPGVVDITDTGSTVVATGAWTFVAVTHTGTSYKFYIGSGTPNSDISNANNPGSGTGALSICSSGTNRMTGSLVNPRIYSRELSGAEITTLIAGGEPSSTGLVLDYRFAEGSGTTAADSSGNNHTGTLTNGPTWSTDVPTAPISAGLIDSEVIVMASTDSSTSGEEGIQTFGAATGRTIIQGKPVVVNEMGADADTRVEGDTDANLIFVDASTDRVGIGTATPAVKLDVVGNVSVSDEAYGSSWNGSTNVPTKNAIYDKLETVASDDLFDHFADANNGTTVETDLYSDTLAAGQLSANGQKITASYQIVCTGAALASQEMRVYFGGTLIYDSGALSIGAITANFTFYVNIIRESSTVVRCWISVSTDFATLFPYSKYTRVTGLTLSSTNILKVTGQASGASGASNQITSVAGYVQFVPAA